MKSLSQSAATAVLLCGVVWAAGCGRAKQEPVEAEAAAKTRPPAAPTEVAAGDADLLQNVPVGSSATNAAVVGGDLAWRELLKAMRPPSPPPEWETTPPTAEVQAAFEKSYGNGAAAAAAQARDFYTKFPKHEMAGEARERELNLLGVAAQFGNTNALERLNALEEAKLKDPKLSEDEALELRVSRLQRIASAQPANPTATLTRLEEGTRALMKEFPARKELSGLLLSIAQGWMDEGQSEKAGTLAREIAAGNSPAEVQAAAQALVKKLDRAGKPIAIKFKAVDGREVDLQALKGRVILIDFWATWCGPCMAELPKVKAAYEKLHARGFEIIGISLDREKAALEKVVAREKMAWPQHFEETAEANKFAEEFGIESIPTMWLVDKQGRLRDLNGRENMVEKVEKLLAE